MRTRLKLSRHRFPATGYRLPATGMRGFTLIELMAVILLLAIVLPIMNIAGAVH
jgi:prepilin-type N-terminal cleavage/methylation domain-containing protein